MKDFVVGVVSMVGNSDDEKIRGIVSKFLVCSNGIQKSTPINVVTIYSVIIVWGKIPGIIEKTKLNKCLNA